MVGGQQLVKKEIAKRQLPIGVKIHCFERTDRGPALRPQLTQIKNEKMGMGWIGTVDKSERT